MYSEAKTQLHTLRDLLRFAVSRFNEAGLSFGHGSASAYDEAVYLILHTLHLPLDQLEPFLDARLTTAELEQVLRIIERRAIEKIPAAYLTKEAWLGDFSFYVDERVIVPRSFIAELLRERLVPWIEEPDGIHSALDLCTGSGCLAVLLAYAFENAAIDATDISQEALQVAQKNVTDYGRFRRSVIPDRLNGLLHRGVLRELPPAHLHRSPRQYVVHDDTLRGALSSMLR